ncbi:MAG TPA: PAS domain-containing protein [Bacteroidia bacterium]|nr:PAS domain-containing protein [Bacteroidia bacterium]
MVEYKIKHEVFILKYLPEFADYLLKNKLKDFVTVGIRFSREADLPLLKPLSRFSEDELVALSLDSNREILDAISKNMVADLIEANTKKWVENTLGIIDKDELSAEDLTLGFFLRRKIFAYFLDGYTKNVVLQKFIIAELDSYTTQEEMISYNIYLKMQQEKMDQINKNLAFSEELFLEAQKLAGIGSFLLDMKDESKNTFTPEYKKIFEIEGRVNFETFMEWVHPSDRSLLKDKIDKAYKDGGIYEVEYRYNKGNKEKKIWSKGIVTSENGHPALIRGVVREIA